MVESSSLNPAQDISKLIQSFNSQVEISPLLQKRREVHSLPTVFLPEDSPMQVAFNCSPPGFCFISKELEALLLQNQQACKVIHYDLRLQGKKCQAVSFGAKIRQALPKLLRLVAKVDLNLQQQLCQCYNEDQKAEIMPAIERLGKEFQKYDFAQVESKSVVDMIAEKLKPPKELKKPCITDLSLILPKKRSEAEVLQLKESGKLSVREICQACKITIGKYYSISKRSKLAEERKESQPKIKLIKSKLLNKEISYLKELADDPKRSYSCGEMQVAFQEKFGFVISAGLIRYHLVHTLGYSYKRNSFKPIPFFSSGQAVVSYKVGERLLNYLHDGKTVIFVDETAFHMGLHREYSYSKVGVAPIRIKGQEIQKLHVVMAISCSRILAYQIRREAYNEHAFVSFILDLAQMILKNKDLSEPGVVLFMDNATFHRSRLPTLLYQILPFQVLFNAPSNPDLNPIENVFQILKARIKKQNITSL